MKMFFNDDMALPWTLAVAPSCINHWTPFSVMDVKRCHFTEALNSTFLNYLLFWKNMLLMLFCSRWLSRQSFCGFWGFSRHSRYFFFTRVPEILVINVHVQMKAILITKPNVSKWVLSLAQNSQKYFRRQKIFFPWHLQTNCTQFEFFMAKDAFHLLRYSEHLPQKLWAFNQVSKSTYMNPH